MLHRFYISLSPTPSGVLDMQPGHVLCGFLSSFLFMTQIIDKIITVHALCLGGVDFCHCLSFPLPLSVYKCVYGSFSFPPQRLKPNQTDDAKLLHFTEVRFSSRVHIVNIIINKLLLGMYIFLNCSPIIMSLTFSSGNWRKKKNSPCHPGLSHYPPSLSLVLYQKKHKTLLACSPVSGNHGDNHSSRTKHSEKFSCKAGKKCLTLAAL